MWTPTSNSDELKHSRGPWKKHKYVKIDANGNYIYPNDAGAMERHRVAKADAATQAAQQRGMRRTMDERSAQARRDVEAARQKEERNRQAKAAASRYQRQGIKKTGSEKERAREKAIAARERENLNERNLNAARKKAARAEGARKTTLENAKSKAQRQGMKRTQQVKDAQRERYVKAKNAAKEAQFKGFKDTVRVGMKNRKNRLRDQRNAEGRLAARKQIAAGNQRSRDEAARLRKLNAVNTTRKAQKQGMAKTGATRRAADLATARKAVEAGRRNELNNRNLDAARNKAARVKREKQLREQRNAAGRLSARKQIAEGNREARLRDQRNAEGRIAARKQGVKLNNTAKKSTSLRLGAKATYAQRSGDKAGAERYNKQKRIADKVYVEGLRRDYFGRDAILKKKDPNKLPARLDVAAKQAGNAISREAYRTGYKARKAAKSVSSAAREAWNSASSYRNQFKDFKSFLKWYKNNRAK